MSPQAQYIRPEQLCIGLYIQLELGWWEHDFAFSNFRIKDEGQIRALRSLGLKRLRYDPSRSDCEPLPLDIPDSPAPPPPQEDPEARARESRAQKLRKLRQRVAEVDRRFVQASQRVKALNQTLRSRPEEAIQQAGAIVVDLVDTLLGEPGVVLHSITGKAAEDAYFHALNVTVLALLLGRQLGLDAEACHSLGLGALLHDIGKMEVPSKVLLKPGPLTRPEQQLLQLHTEFGLRMGQRLMLDDEVLRIIHEHHEHCDGTGYPRGLREAGIGRLSKLAAIANQFDNLCNPPDPRNALSPHEALALMFKQQRSRFDEVALKAFIRAMGVYPPGSLVQLDDERYALVLGMNPTLPLRPTVVLHDPGIPKQEALILDLEQEPGLAIARSLRPSQLPIEVLEYLNPRQQLTYYVEPGRG
ncbi:HD-GYP domain-containing protein [Metapseudomonas furukawaii]|uniref:HD-GYP domain protein n=1 Tax=Metapseudomonas furukawaii TaxID=1149133 RepID=A0AAD1C5G8_METFU|nr:HD-GYP domain-containing protein [Pseudomonas furukawaii]ELS27062.1 metal dependent phosphohydrolase [Pseudomonas furukawaii]BAU76956.1 HD-GYP domain protein [Pseudomonas furukawaii]